MIAPNLMPLARLSSACAIAMMMLLAALPAKAAPEVQANTFTQGDQKEPAIAKIANGYVVVWSSNGQDGLGFGIYGQRYTLDGAKLGAELRISEIYGRRSTKAARGRSRRWKLRRGLDGYQASAGFDIYAAVFKANGLKRSGEVRLGAAKGSRGPTVAALANGGFVVVWDPHVGQPGQADIHGRIYDFSKRGRSAMSLRSMLITRCGNPGLALRRLLTEVSSHCGPTMKYLASVTICPGGGRALHSRSVKAMAAAYHQPRLDWATVVLLSSGAKIRMPDRPVPASMGSAANSFRQQAPNAAESSS